MMVFSAISLLNLTLPLSDMFSYDFMRNAFLAGTAMAVLGGLTGYFVVIRGLAFAGEALSHVAFAAVLFAVLAGINPLLGLFAITVGIGMGTGLLGNRARARDEAIGTVLAWVLGLGALLLAIYTSQSSGGDSRIGINTLFGSILGIEGTAAWEAVAVAAAAVIALLAICRPLLFASIDPDVALARGVPVRSLGVLFLAIVAITVAESVQVVGALLVLSLLVLPGATAQRLTVHPYRGLALSVVLGVLVTWIGLTLAFYTPYPPSFLITTLAFVSYVLVATTKQLRRYRTSRRFNEEDRGFRAAG